MDDGFARSEGMQESMSIADRSDAIVNFVGGLLTTYGWTAIFLGLVWYNWKDTVWRSWGKLRNERSAKHANRPARRELLDRERARTVALKQTEATETARLVAEENIRNSIKRNADDAMKND